MLRAMQQGARRFRPKLPDAMTTRAALLMLLWALPAPVSAHGLVMFVTTPITPPFEYLWLERLFLGGMILAGALFLRMARGFSLLRSFGTSFLVHLLFFLTFWGISVLCDSGSTAPFPSPGVAEQVLWGFDWERVKEWVIIWNLTGLGVMIFAWAMILGFADAIAETGKSAGLAIVLVLLMFSWPFIMNPSGPAGIVSIFLILGIPLGCFSQVFRADRPVPLRVLAVLVPLCMLVVPGLLWSMHPFFAEWLRTIAVHLLFPTIALTVFWPQFKTDALKSLPAAIVLSTILYALALAPYMSMGAYCTGWTGSYASRWCPELREQWRWAIGRHAFFHAGKPPQGTRDQIFAAALPFLDREKATFPEPLFQCPLQAAFSKTPQSYFLATGTMYPKTILRGNDRYATGSVRMISLPFKPSRRGWPIPLCLDQHTPNALSSEDEYAYATESMPVFFDPASAPTVSLASWQAADSRDDTDAIPPLFLAIRSGDINLVQSLLDAGATATRQAWGNLSALHIAAITDQATIARLLVERGAVLEAEDLTGRTPLFVAAEIGSTDTIETLHHLGARCDRPLVSRFQAMSRGLLTDPRDGWTPLHAAAAHGHATTIQALLRIGASRTSISAAGKTPYDLARSWGHWETGKLLELE